MIAVKVTKAVKDLNALIAGAFVEGTCSCSRCKDSGGDQTKYNLFHSFQYEGAFYKKLFARTGAEQLSAAVEKAWKSVYGKEVIGDDISALLFEENIAWYGRLLLANVPRS